MFILKRLLHPEIFQGINRKKNYFEGWYFKCVSQNLNNIMAFIPGVSFGSSLKDSHAFIQVLDASRNRSGYFTFELSDFNYAEDRLELKLGNNIFSSSGMTVSLQNHDMAYDGRLEFKSPVPFPKSFWNPGIMGPFGFLSFMECYHDVVHMNHRLAGTLLIDNEPQDFFEGAGYIEKDWGTSFPRSWVWIQCNHFTDPDVSFMLSYAHIPFLGRSFKGLISFFSVNGQLYRFSTYQGAHVTSLNYQNGKLLITVENRLYCMKLMVKVESGSQLKAPKKGAMISTILESMNSHIEMVLMENNGHILFRGDGSVTGVEAAGDLSELDCF